MGGTSGDRSTLLPQPWSRLSPQFAAVDIAALHIAALISVVIRDRAYIAAVGSVEKKKNIFRIVIRLFERIVQLHLMNCAVASNSPRKDIHEFKSCI